jgi:hypothetical protein
MDEKRRILILEIEHWRKSKLLPEHYCDFLLNIYLEDSSEKPTSGSGFLGVTPSAIKNSNWKIWIMIFAVLALISFTALNFIRLLLIFSLCGRKLAAIQGTNARADSFWNGLLVFAVYRSNFA